MIYFIKVSTTAECMGLIILVLFIKKFRILILICRNHHIAGGILEKHFLDCYQIFYCGKTDITGRCLEILFLFFRISICHKFYVIPFEHIRNFCRTTIDIIGTIRRKLHIQTAVFITAGKDFQFF